MHVSVMPRLYFCPRQQIEYHSVVRPSILTWEQSTILQIAADFIKLYVGRSNSKMRMPVATSPSHPHAAWFPSTIMLTAVV